MRNSANYSPRTVEAAELLGTQIRIGRLERRWTVQELAERVGVSVVTLRKIERGDPSVGLGISFEAATLTGVPLFYEEQSRLSTELGRAADRLAVLPSRARKPREVNDAF
ncbi:MAG TPA: helix-turn-helix transcriptional regulator [Solirubrobacterales bacterium]|nr:helix-turn-helix transcriptional regulator [Solirubrobacterales bacterium]